MNGSKYPNSEQNASRIFSEGFYRQDGGGTNEITNNVRTGGKI